jgi:hypothetical protein
LRRFLHKQVGRPWDKVLSEICEFIRLDSAVQSHVRDHLEDFVEIHVFEQDGILCHGHGWFLGKPLNMGRWCQFYVCPRTGLLCRIKPRKQMKPKLPIESVPLAKPVGPPGEVRWRRHELLVATLRGDQHFRQAPICRLRPR